MKTGSVLNQVSTIAAGDRYGTALTRDRKIYTWGINEDMQLGFDSDVGNSGIHESWTAKLKEDITDAERVSAGYSHTAVYKLNGEVYTWGKGSAGELGNGENFDYYTPRLVRQGYY